MNANRLVKSITKIPKDGSDACEVADELLQRISASINETTIDEVLQCLFKELQATSGITRIRAIHALNKLFRCSNLARAAIVSDIRTIVDSTCVIPTSSSSASKRASAYHDKYTQTTLAYLDAWDEKYGKSHSSLRSITRYLRDTLRVSMPNRRLQKKQAQEKKHRQINQLLNRCSAAMANVTSCLRDIEENYNQLKTCFDILFPDFFSMDATDISNSGAAVTSPQNTTEDECGDVAWEDEELPPISFEETLAITGITSSYALNLLVPLDREAITTIDNSVLVNTIADYAKQLKKHDLTRLCEWEAMFGYCVKNMNDSMSNNHTREQVREMHRKILEIKRNVEYMVNTRCEKFLSSTTTTTTSCDDSSAAVT